MHIDNSKPMETKGVTFLCPSPSDYTDLLELYLNESVRKYLGGPINKNLFDKKFHNILSPCPPEYYWVIRESKSKRFIGLVSITKHHDKTHFEISYELHPDFWGRGLGTAVVSKGIEYSFYELGLEELYAETQKNNLRSVCLLEKVGMKPIAKVERFGEQQIIFSIKNKITAQET